VWPVVSRAFFKPKVGRKQKSKAILFKRFAQNNFAFI